MRRVRGCIPIHGDPHLMSEAGQSEKKGLLEFGEFTLNLDRRGLYRGQERVRLTAKPLETLIFLLSITAG